LITRTADSTTVERGAIVNEENLPPTVLTRRGMLAAGGAATASVALLGVAGCATYSSGSAASPPPAAAPAGSPPATGAPPAAPGDGAGAGDSDGAGASSGADSAGSGGTVLGPTSAVPVGGGKVFDDQSVVVTQPKAGTFQAFDTTCPHAGCAVNTVSGGTINCPCHGSKFRVADGSVAHGPATRPLTAKEVTASGGQLRIS
jgi:nitrite reductase/ring-hydroxylating ferredoxin subunit